MKLFVSAAEAKSIGCTHESRLYGVPGYSARHPSDEDQMMFVPKFTPLVLFTVLMDKLSDLAMHFVPEDQTYVAPFVEIREL